MLITLTAAQQIITSKDQGDRSIDRSSSTMAAAQQHLQLLLVSVVLMFLVIMGGAASSSSSMQMQMQCDEEDEAALLAVSAALGSPYHLSSSWTPDVFCCDWYAVDCDNATGRVVGLAVVGDGNLTAVTAATTIPVGDALANLTSLRTLVLRRLPGLTGAIPDSLALLSATLSQLTISGTGVSGPVPAFLSELRELTLLDLSFNALDGAIPPSLADLPALSSVDLSRNRLTGALPPLLFANLNNNSDQQQLAYLRLSHNNLTGGIPAGFAGVRFAHLDLSRNALAGDASVVFGKKKPLQHLDLSRNGGFAFSLTAVELPEQLGYLDLSHNAIRGRIPAQVADLAGLQLFNVSYNRMCGVVPTGGNMGKFDAYSYQHNRCLCGTPLPACGGHH